MNTEFGRHFQGGTKYGVAVLLTKEQFWGLPNSTQHATVGHLQKLKRVMTHDSNRCLGEMKL